MIVGWMLSDDSVLALLGLPESGMGFQFVAGQSNGRRALLLVFNSELAYDISYLPLAESQDPATILLNGTRVVDAISRAPMVVGRPEPHSLSLITSRVVAKVGPPTAPSVSSPVVQVAQPSSLVKSYTPSANRLFHRFSAFNPDRRVNPATGDFAPGTYAAPDSEVPFVPTGFAAVGRFALPNVQPASHHYVIKAPAGAAVAFGTVAPAFGQAGGGVEAFFAQAVTNQLVPPLPPSQIPDE